MKREGGQATPLFFYLLVTTFATWAAIAYQLTVIMMNPEAMLGPLAKSLNTASLLGIQVLSMALAPLLLILVAYCAAGIFHLVFQLLGGAQPFQEKKNYGPIAMPWHRLPSFASFLSAGRFTYSLPPLSSWSSRFAKRWVSMVRARRSG